MLRLLQVMGQGEKGNSVTGRTRLYSGFIGRLVMMTLAAALAVVILAATAFAQRNAAQDQYDVDEPTGPPPSTAGPPGTPTSPSNYPSTTPPSNYPPTPNVKEGHSQIGNPNQAGQPLNPGYGAGQSQNLTQGQNLGGQQNPHQGQSGDSAGASQQQQQGQQQQNGKEPARQETPAGGKSSESNSGGGKTPQNTNGAGPNTGVSQQNNQSGGGSQQGNQSGGNIPFYTLGGDSGRQDTLDAELQRMIATEDCALALLKRVLGLVPVAGTELAVPIDIIRIGLRASPYMNEGKYKEALLEVGNYYYEDYLEKQARVLSPTLAPLHVPRSCFNPLIWSGNPPVWVKQAS